MTTLVLSILNGSSSFLQTIRPTVKAWMSLYFIKIPSRILELAPLEHLKIDEKCCDCPCLYIFDWISFILSSNKDIIKDWMSLKFCKIRPMIYELAALEHLEKSP